MALAHAIRLLRLRVTVAEIKCTVRLSEVPLSPLSTHPRPNKLSPEENIRFFLICESGFYLKIYVYREIEGPNGM